MQGSCQKKLVKSSLPFNKSAFRLPTDEKRAQEERPLLGVRDAFKKIVVVRDNIMLKRDDRGVTTMGLKEFLLDPDSLDL